MFDVSYICYGTVRIDEKRKKKGEKRKKEKRELAGPAAKTEKKEKKRPYAWNVAQE